MKLTGRFILNHNEMGRKFFIIGPVDSPRAGSIYATDNEATDYSQSDLERIVERFGSRVKIEVVK